MVASKEAPSPALKGKRVPPSSSLLCYMSVQYHEQWSPGRIWPWDLCVAFQLELNMCA